MYWRHNKIRRPFEIALSLHVGCWLSGVHVSQGCRARAHGSTPHGLRVSFVRGSPPVRRRPARPPPAAPDALARALPIHGLRSTKRTHTLFYNHLLSTLRNPHHNHRTNPTSLIWQWKVTCENFCRLSKTLSDRHCPLEKPASKLFYYSKMLLRVKLYRNLFIHKKRLKFSDCNLWKVYTRFMNYLHCFTNSFGHYFYPS